MPETQGNLSAIAVKFTAMSGDHLLDDDDATLILGYFTTTSVRLRENLMAPLRNRPETTSVDRTASSIVFRDELAIRPTPIVEIISGQTLRSIAFLTARDWLAINSRLQFAENLTEALRLAIHVLCVNPKPENRSTVKRSGGCDNNSVSGIAINVLT